MKVQATQVDARVLEVMQVGHRGEAVLQRLLARVECRGTAPVA